MTQAEPEFEIANSPAVYYWKLAVVTTPAARSVGVSGHAVPVKPSHGPPVHPRKPVGGFAMRNGKELGLKVNVHVPGQLIPAGILVTCPGPTTTTVTSPGATTIRVTCNIAGDRRLLGAIAMMDPLYVPAFRPAMFTETVTVFGVVPLGGESINHWELLSAVQFVPELGALTVTV